MISPSLIEEFYKVQSRECSKDKLSLSYEYRSILRQFKADPEVSSLLLLWGLASTCFLENQKDDIDSFIQRFLLFVKHQYLDYSYLLATPLEEEGISNEYCTALAKLVAGRNFEQASLLIRHVQLNSPILSDAMQNTLQFILDCLLSAPTPSTCAEKPESLNQWLLENAQTAITEDIRVPPELDAVFSIVCGQYQNAVSSLNWIELLAVELNYGQRCISNFEMFLSFLSFFECPSGEWSLFNYCLRLEWTCFVDELVKRSLDSLSCALFTVHFVPLVDEFALQECGGSHCPFYGYAKYVLHLDHKFWKYALYYLQYSSNSSSDIITDLIRSLSIDELVNLEEVYPQYSLLVNKHLRSQCWSLYQSQNYEAAYTLAVKCTYHFICDEILSIYVSKICQGTTSLNISFFPHEHIRLLGFLNRAEVSQTDLVEIIRKDLRLECLDEWILSKASNLIKNETDFTPELISSLITWSSNITKESHHLNELRQSLLSLSSRFLSITH